MMLAHKPIRLHPDKPNNYNPIYEDDYVELGIRAMEVAATPPIVVNWAGSETVSVEDYCAYMGELVGVEPIFDYMDRAKQWMAAFYERAYNERDKTESAVVRAEYLRHFFDRRADARASRTNTSSSNRSCRRSRPTTRRP